MNSMIKEIAGISYLGYAHRMEVIKKSRIISRLILNIIIYVQNMKDMELSNFSLEQQYAKIEDQVRRNHQYKYRNRKAQKDSNPHQYMIQQQVFELNQENQALKAYVEQLSEYVQDSSEKYSKNIETLKDSYREMYNNLTTKQVSLEQQLLLSNNSVLMEKEVRMVRQKQIQQKEIQIQKHLQTINNQQGHVRELKEKLDEKWNEIQNQKRIWNQIMEKLNQEYREKCERQMELKGILKEKDIEIIKLSKQVITLQNELTTRYSLPDKIKNCEIKLSNDDVVIKQLKNRIQQIERELDFTKTDLKKKDKEREELRIKNVKFEQSFQAFFSKKIQSYEQDWNQKANQYEEIIARAKLELQKERQSNAKLNKMKLELDNDLQRKQRQVQKLEKDMRNEQNEKDSYLNEFRQLKKNYEMVINTLQDSVKELQKRNWNLEDEKRDLEDELVKFRELATQLSNINELATAGVNDYYVSQMKKLTSKNIDKIKRQDVILMKEQVQRQMFAKKKNQKSKGLSEYEINTIMKEQDDNQFQWDQLINGINSLKVKNQK